MFEKYEKAFALVNNVIDINSKVVAEVDENVLQELQKNLNIAINELFSYFNNEFTAPDSKEDNTVFDKELEEISKCFDINVKDIVTKIYDLPPTIPEFVYPVAVARYLLTARQVRFIASKPYIVDGKETFPWKEFADRYAQLIWKAL